MNFIIPKKQGMHSIFWSVQIIKSEWWNTLFVSTQKRGKLILGYWIRNIHEHLRKKKKDAREMNRVKKVSLSSSIFDEMSDIMIWIVCHVLFTTKSTGIIIKHYFTNESSLSVMIYYCWNMCVSRELWLSTMANSLDLFSSLDLTSLDLNWHVFVSHTWRNGNMSAD